MNGKPYGARTRLLSAHSPDTALGGVQHQAWPKRTVPVMGSVADRPGSTQPEIRCRETCANPKIIRGHGARNRPLRIWNE
eukprot:281833-Prymnesium_polylepis.1